ncbi:hypothetical protein [Paenibacillus borealis]|uniref:hypothetical protein n=1 Tax=Paenibacillus borealis TaxID=160799 RepID=UPI000B01A43B|nr:hypothetical protein [Paenibacillus borealis]
MMNNGTEQVLELQRVLKQIITKLIPVHVGCLLLSADGLYSQEYSSYLSAGNSDS